VILVERRVASSYCCLFEFDPGFIGWRAGSSCFSSAIAIFEENATNVPLRNDLPAREGRVTIREEPMRTIRGLSNS